jgi:hypothetical protein
MSHACVYVFLLVGRKRNLDCALCFGSICIYLAPVCLHIWVTDCCGILYVLHFCIIAGADANTYSFMPRLPVATPRILFRCPSRLSRMYGMPCYSNGISEFLDNLDGRTAIWQKFIQALSYLTVQDSKYEAICPFNNISYF